jgi:hypothetical protein
VREHDRVVVHVYDPRPRCLPLGDLVDVVLLRDAGADVEELPDPRLVNQMAHDPAEEGSVGACVVADALEPAGPRGIGPLGRLPVDLEVGGPAKKVVVDTRHVRDGGVNLGRLPLGAIARLSVEFHSTPAPIG